MTMLGSLVGIAFSMRRFVERDALHASEHSDVGVILRGRGVYELGNSE